MIDGLGDEAEAKFFADVSHDLQAGFAVALKTIGRSARLEGPAAEEARATGFDLLGNDEGLVVRLDGAGTGNHSDFCAPESHCAESRRDADDGRFGFYVAAN